MSARLPQPAKFVLVGTGGFALNVLAFTALFGVGAWYVGNRYFTFGLSHVGFLAAYVRYAVAGAVVAVLTALLLAAFVEGLGLDPRLGQALALCLLIPVAFLLSKRFAFRLRSS